MPKPTPKKTEGSKIISPEEFMGGAVASNAEKGQVETSPKSEIVEESQEVSPKPKPRKRGEAKKKEATIFVGVRIPESTAAMLEEYDQNYAMRGESKNSIMVEGIRREISSRLRKAKGSRGGEE